MNKLNLKTSYAFASCLLAAFSFFTIGLSPVASEGQEIPWTTNVQTAIAKAQSENKLVLLHFTADWCRPCRALETFVFSSIEVINMAKQNVVPVLVDVDQQENVATEYSVTSVPFDVIITPGGRIISKRKSPLDARGYQKMLASLSTPLKNLEDSAGPGLKEQLNDLKDQFQVNPRSLKPALASAAPAAPSHSAPVPSADAAELARRSRVQNPFFQKPDTFNQPAPQAVKNQFVAAQKPSPQPQPKQVSATKVDNIFATTGSHGDNQFRPSGGANAVAMRNEIPLSAKAQPNPPLSESALKHFLTESLETSAPTLPATGQVAKQETLAKPHVLQPNRIQNDQFFKDPIQLEPVDNTRVVAPNRTAQRLLEPVLNSATVPGRYPIAPETEKNKPNTRNAASAMLEPNHDFLNKALQPQTASANVTKSAVAIDSAKQSPSNANYGLRGKCPVTLLQQSKWVDGNPKFGCVHRDRVYIFADQAKLQQFQRDPDLYSPILAGHDPVVFHDQGSLVGGKEQHGVFMGKAPNQRIVLFSNAETRAKFQANPDLYLSTVRQAMAASGGSSSPMIR